MRYLKITQEELSALNGLPHLQQLLYLRGIKPYIDYRTGIVGIMRGISYQSLAEALYIEPHQGIKSGSPSKDQIRRAIKGLEKAGLLRIQSMEWKLIFQCLLTNQDYFKPNKPAANPHVYSATVTGLDLPLKSRVIQEETAKLIMAKNEKGAIPQDNNHFIFLLQQFETFWELYPLKKSKQKTWEQFQALKPNEALIERIFAALEMQIVIYNQIKTQGQWVPGWKFPANWLAQHCWEDEIDLHDIRENQHAKNQQHHTAKQSVDPFWDSCKDGTYFTEDDDSNVIDLNGVREANKTH